MSGGGTVLLCRYTDRAICHNLPNKSLTNKGNFDVRVFSQDVYELQCAVQSLTLNVLYQVRSPPVSPSHVGDAGGVERVRGRHRRLPLPRRRPGLHRSAGGMPF